MRSRHTSRKGIAVGLIKGFTKRIEDPAQPGEYVSIRMLSHFELEAAAEEGIVRMGERAKRLTDMRSAIAAAPAADLDQARARIDSEKRTAEVHPLSGYDVLTLLKLGV